MDARTSGLLDSALKMRKKKNASRVNRFGYGFVKTSDASC